MCNLAYAWLRADLAAEFAMAEPKDRRQALDDFDLNLNAPAEGWEAADARLLAAIRTGE